MAHLSEPERPTIEVVPVYVDPALPVRPLTVADVDAMADYWVVDVEGRQLHVHRKPEHGQYRDIGVHREDVVVTALAIPLDVQVAALLEAP